MSEKTRRGAERPGPGGDKGYVLVDLDRDLIPLPQDLEARGIVEQQQLRVRQWRLASATTMIPSDDGDRVDSHLTITLVGEPGERSEARTAVLVFVADGAPLRAPSYDAAARRMMIEFPLSRLRSIEDVLRREDEVYCMYQGLESGQVWADLHTKLEDVGRG